MNNSQLQPYLHFNGNCEEAMKFYQSVLGGKLEINRYSDFAKTDEEVAASAEQKQEGVMHSTLENDSLTFMASDGAEATEIVFGTNFSMSLAGTDEEQLTKFFNGLGEGGQVTMPLAKQIWGDTFGMLTDKYGIHWMVNIANTAPVENNK